MSVIKPPAARDRTAIPESRGLPYLGVHPSGGAPEAASTAVATPAPATADDVPVPPSSSAVARFGFVLLQVYLISAPLNDWAIRLLGNKAYLSIVSLLLLPFFFIASGRPLRGLKDRIGICWVALLICMALSVPTSFYKSESASYLFSYFGRNFSLYFYICAFTVSMAQVRRLLYVLMLSDVALLLTCAKFGSNVDGRLAVPDSFLYSNANELALYLLIAVTHFAFLLYVGGTGRRIAAVLAIVLSLLFMLKTASRGSLVAVVALLIVMFVLSHKKAMFAVLVVPTAVIVLLLSPSSALHRLSLIAFSASSVTASELDDLSAIGSQAERTALFRKSIEMTLQHPLLGVGLNEFAVAVSGEAAKTGVWAAWRGTHNSYTQVSSECGIPALILYLSIIWLSIRNSYKLYKQTRSRPEFREIAGISLSVCMGLVVYAVATWFFHIAYTNSLLILSGSAAALRMAAQPLLTNLSGSVRK